MEKRLKQMKQMPSAFVCANDFIAVNVMKALKNNQIAIPATLPYAASIMRLNRASLNPIYQRYIFIAMKWEFAANMLLSGERTGVTLSSHPYPNKTDLQGIDRKTD